MSRSHDRLTYTLRQFKTSLRTGATPVVPMRATESGKCQTFFCKSMVYFLNMKFIGVPYTLKAPSQLTEFPEICLAKGIFFQNRLQW